MIQREIDRGGMIKHQYFANCGKQIDGIIFSIHMEQRFERSMSCHDSHGHVDVGACSSEKSDGENATGVVNWTGPVRQSQTVLTRRSRSSSPHNPGSPFRMHTENLCIA